jgi:CspA family cold shock protein
MIPPTKREERQRRRRTIMSKTTLQDEICYCTHCGISFVWTQEEQQAATVQPGLCPGCRQLAPTAGRARGMVKWYDRRKQYGFLVRQGQPDIYVHRSGLRAGGALQPGDLVEFSIESSARGPAAVDVAVLRPAAPAKAK